MRAPALLRDPKESSIPSLPGDAPCSSPLLPGRSGASPADTISRVSRVDRSCNRRQVIRRLAAVHRRVESRGTVESHGRTTHGCIVRRRRGVTVRAARGARQT